MNRENLAKLIEVLESVPDEKFNMEYWLASKKNPTDKVTNLRDAKLLWGAHKCNTVACIAGTCQLYFDEAPEEMMNASQFSRGFLGMSSSDAFHVFRGRWHPEMEHYVTPGNLAKITRQETIDYLKTCLEKGEWVNLPK